MLRFCLFETAIGECALIQSEAGITGSQLPAADRDAALFRIARHWPGAEEQSPDAEATCAIGEIRALLAGRQHDFTRFALDLATASPFNRSVYVLTSAIPVGETRTYGELARALGDVSLSRAVGKALGENPVPIIVPCHRILGAEGKTGGFSAPGGLDTKFRLLNIELAFARSTPNLFGDKPLPLARRCGWPH